MESRFVRVDGDDDDIFIMSESVRSNGSRPQVKSETYQVPAPGQDTDTDVRSIHSHSVPWNQDHRSGSQRVSLLPDSDHRSSFHPAAVPAVNEGPPPGTWMGHHPPPQQQAGLPSFHHHLFPKASSHSHVREQIIGSQKPSSCSSEGQPLVPDPRNSASKVRDSRNVMTSKESHDSTSRTRSLTQIQNEPEKLKALVDTLFQRQPTLASTSIGPPTLASASIVSSIGPPTLASASIVSTSIGPLFESTDESVPAEKDGQVEKFISRMKPLVQEMREECKDLKLHPAVSETTLDEYYAVLPPIETFMGVSPEGRLASFYKQLQVGDILVGEIERKTETGFVLVALSTDAGKRRDLTGLNVRLFCPYSESILHDPHVKIYDSYSLKDLIRVQVIDSIPVQSKISVSMKCDSLPKEVKDRFKLGVMNEDDLPLHYKRIKTIGNASYHVVLDGILSFNNPAATEYLFRNLVQPEERKHLSLIDSLRKKSYEEKEMAVSLKRIQSARWASKSVQLGVQLLKEGKRLEAHQAVGKALQIDPENVDAFVTRGCLHANNDDLKKGIQDFEQALKLNPNHSNARKYCAETLIALGSQFEGKGDYLEAEKMYKKSMRVDGRNVQGKERLDRLLRLMKRRKLSPAKESSTTDVSGKTPSAKESSTNHVSGKTPSAKESSKTDNVSGKTSSAKEASYHGLSNPERPDALTETQEKLLSLLKSESCASTKKKKKEKKKKKKKSSRKRKKHRHHSSSDSSGDSSSSDSSSSESDSSSDSDRRQKSRRKEGKRCKKFRKSVVDLSPSPDRKGIEPRPGRTLGPDPVRSVAPIIEPRPGRTLGPDPVRSVAPMGGLVPLFPPRQLDPQRYASPSTSSSIRPSVERILRKRREEEILGSRQSSSGRIPGLDFLQGNRSESRTPPSLHASRYSGQDFSNRDRSNSTHSSRRHSTRYSPSHPPSHLSRDHSSPRRGSFATSPGPSQDYSLTHRGHSRDGTSGGHSRDGTSGGHSRGDKSGGHSRGDKSGGHSRDSTSGGHRDPRTRSRSPGRASPRSRSRTPPRVVDHRRSDGHRSRDRRFDSARRRRSSDHRRPRYVSYTPDAIARRDRQELSDLAKILRY